MIGQTSCRHCGRGQLSKLVKASVAALEEALGCQLYCNSGCRCEEHNSATKGASPYSQHKIRDIGDEKDVGNAVDVWTPERTMSEVYWAAMDCPAFFNGGVGLYFTAKGWFIHLDGRGYKRRFAYYHGKRLDLDSAIAMMEADALR